MKVSPYRGLSLTKDSVLVKTVSTFANINQIKSDVIKTAGKVAISPAVILYNPFTKEDKKSRKYSALIQPLEALWVLGSCFMYNKIGGKVVKKLAKKNLLGDMYNTAKKVGKDRELAKKSLKILQDRVTFAINFALMPITSYLTCKSFASIANQTLNKDKIENMENIYEGK